MSTPWLVMSTVAALSASCATVSSQPALIPSAPPLDLGPGIRTLAVMPVPAPPGSPTLQSLNDAMTRELATYTPMFASVFVFNTAFAVDTWLSLGKAAGTAPAPARST